MASEALSVLHEAESGPPIAPDDSAITLDQHHFYFWKGRVALYAILKAMGIGPGDQVLVPGYTCVVVPAAVCFCGAEPVFVDIDPGSYNVSLKRIEAAARGVSRIAAVIIQHTYGLPVETAPIVEWARQEKVALIEDCCHSLGARYVGERGEWGDVGSQGDAAFFSSQWSKPVSTGLGGWAATRSSALAERLLWFSGNECSSPSWAESTVLAAEVLGRALVSSSSLFWFAQATYRFLARTGLAIGSSEEAELRGKMPAQYAKRMGWMQRRLLDWKLKGFAASIPRRRYLAAVYGRALADAGFSTLDVSGNVDPVLLRYPVRVGNKVEVLDLARRRRIELGDWFDHPLHPKTSDSGKFGYQSGVCPNAEVAAAQVVNLPIHDGVNEEIARLTVNFLSGVARPIH